MYIGLWFFWYLVSLMASSARAGMRSRPNTDMDLVATYLRPDNYMSPNLLNQNLRAEGLSAECA